MRRVLIIDDDENVRHLLGLRLQHAGFEVGQAADGTAGLAAIRSGEWDLILLDLVMPNMNGFEFLGEVRSLPRPPVVVITQIDDFETQDRAMALGATEFVPKRSVFSRKFVTAVQKLLDHAA